VNKYKYQLDQPYKNLLILRKRDNQRDETTGKKGKMAKLHFFYGVMSASKSAQLGINAYNFSRTENKWEAIKPQTDDRDSKTDIVSRVGIRTKANALKDLQNYKPKQNTQFILVDEVQFFSVEDIKKLVKIADTTKITIFCYGLKIDSNGNLFPASAQLLADADELHCMETVCEIPGCTEMASHHIRYDNFGRIIRDGNQVEVGASQYKSVCRKDFYNLYYNKSMNLLQYVLNKKLHREK
jgi:thymidine kinase